METPDTPETRAAQARLSRILLVDDEQHIADVVVYVLEEQGFEVQTCLDGVSGLQAFEAHPPDLLLLDLNLPGLDGFEVFRRLRVGGSAVPVIMLTSKGEEIDRILGLELGADDYVTKPFSPRELAARVRAVLRRRIPSESTAPPLLRHGWFEIDETGYRVRYAGRNLTLTRPEFELLTALVKQPARVFTRDRLIEVIHEQDHPVTDRAIDACVKRLRRKLQGVRPGEDPIQTVYGLGYKLRHDPESA